MDAPSEQAPDFGRRLRQLRIAAGLTQAELAERAGLNPKSVAALERGRRRKPHLPTLRALATALGLSDIERAALVAAADILHTPSSPAHLPPPARDAGTSLQEPPDAPMLATKLYRPQPGADIVRRLRLHDLLDRCVAGALTIIAAPAGCGKTTLLADWIAATAARPASPISADRVAWLSLEPAENDPAEFIRYLTAAIRSIASLEGREQAALRPAIHSQPVEALLPLLADELMLLPEQSVLILDDYHAIDSPAAHQVLVFLLDHLPPHVHIIIATRSDPPLQLARLRAQRRLAEVRVRDLRFTREETADFLREANALPGESLTARERSCVYWRRAIPTTQ
jgi:transcriptional regulator with XRE-family HTH domain